MCWPVFGVTFFFCIHELLQEMHRAVFAGRDGELLTVGEMPGVTVEDGVLFTDPARGEDDMVFQFEHVQLDQDGTKWASHPLRLTDLKASFGRWQAGLAEVGCPPTSTCEMSLSAAASGAVSGASIGTTYSRGPLTSRK